METATPIGVKFAVTALLAAFILPAVAVATIGQAVVGAAAFTAVGYFVGDAWALPRFGNAGAVVVDFALAAAVFLIVPDLLPGMSVGIGGALTIAGAISLAEILFHTYLNRLQLQSRR